jgi:hypothetical protein
MKNNIEILYLFENDKVYVLESKNTSLPQDAPKDQVFAWLVFNKEHNTFAKLTFQSMAEDTVQGQVFQVREFVQAQLKFDDKFAQFIYEDVLHLLTKVSPSEFGAPLISGVELFLCGS